MEHKTLQHLRIVTPGLLMLLIAASVGAITDAYEVPLPEKFSDMLSLLVVFVLGFAYHLTPLRDLSNRGYFQRVNKDLAVGLSSIAGVSPPLAWNTLRRVFYSFVDRGDLLKILKEQAYFNGYMWTTAADVRALSAVAASIGLLLEAFSVNGGVTLAIVYTAVFILSIPISGLLTKKHRQIGREQLRIMESNFAAEVKAAVKAAGQAGGSASNAGNSPSAGTP